MHRHNSDAQHRQGSSRGLSIAVFCAMAIIALVLWSRKQSGFNFFGGDNILVGCLLSAFAGAISLFGYLLSRNSGRVQSSGLWQLIEGLSALVPPAVIAMCLLPVSAEARPWVLFLFLIIGFFGLVSLTNIELSDGRPHKFHQREYLFDRGLGRPFLATIDVANPETDLPRRSRRKLYRDDDDAYGHNSGRSGARTQSRKRIGSEPVSQPAAPAAPVVDGKLQQQISRFTARNGDDRVEAVWSVHFDRDQKRTVVHVPFSPAFASRPLVECSLVDGDGVTLKVAEVHPYGVRIEARRSQTSRPADVTIGFHASAKQNTSGRSTTTQQVVGNEFSTTIGDAGRAVTGAVVGSGRAVANGGRAVGEVIGDTGRAVADSGRAVMDTGRAVGDAVADTGRAVTDSVTQTASSFAQGASRLKRAVTGSDPVFSLGNPAEAVRQAGERISRTTGPHNPPGEFPADPGSNSSSRRS